jgi:hypothetical protein
MSRSSKVIVALRRIGRIAYAGVAPSQALSTRALVALFAGLMLGTGTAGAPFQGVTDHVDFTPTSLVLPAVQE